jgi:PAS domain S-box-containing protein
MSRSSSLMKGTKSKSKAFAALRHRAEAKLRKKKSGFPVPPPDATRLIHELQVAQVELQMQNEELRRAQLEIEAARDWYADLYDFAPVGYLTLDLQGSILEVNLTGAELLRETRNALVKTPFHAFIDQDYRTAFHLFCRQLLRSAVRQSCELKLVRKDGTPLFARLEGIAAPKAVGATEQYRVSLSDVTERKRADEEIAALNKALADRAEALQAANTELDAFSYSVSHDLRAPIRQVTKLAEILMEEFGPHLAPDAIHYVRRMIEIGGWMERMVQDLLRLSQLERKPLTIRRTPLNPLLERVVDQLGPETENRKIDWSIGRLPEVDCDPDLIKIVFSNLLSNALKYTRTREQAVIQVDQRPWNGQFAIFVRDNGVGFDMNYASRLFGAFQRLHSPPKFDGTGVGLATVRRIIKSHGGKVWAEAEPDKGATFYFTLADTQTSGPEGCDASRGYHAT